MKLREFIEEIVKEELQNENDIDVLKIEEEKKT